MNGRYIRKTSIQGSNVKAIDQFLKDTSKQFSANIINSGVAFDLSRDITDPAGKRVFLKAGLRLQITFD
jgi:hypothetical protein